MRQASVIELDDAQRGKLVKLAQSNTTEVRLARRTSIVLLAAGRAATMTHDYKRRRWDCQLHQRPPTGQSPRSRLVADSMTVRILAASSPHKCT